MLRSFRVSVNWIRFFNLGNKSLMFCGNSIDFSQTNVRFLYSLVHYLSLQLIRSQILDCGLVAIDMGKELDRNQTKP
jgi:hypothetical protein